jgi:hypothetical protein
VGRYIMKASKDDDLYVEWSSVVDDAIFVGTREEMFAHLVREDAASHPGFAPIQGNRAEDRLLRCDETGTSYEHKWPSGNGPEGSWTDSTVQIGQEGTIPRDKLCEYALAMKRNDMEARDKLITPFVWDD